MRTSYGTGRYQASEGDILIKPRIPYGTRGVVYCAGRTATAKDTLTANLFGLDMLIALGRANLRTLTADWGGGTTWGNDTARTRIGTGVTYHGTASGVATDKILLLGLSMGTITAMRYAMQNPTKIAALALVLPVVDLVAFRNANTGGYQAEIDTAYGGAPSSGQNPASNTSSFTGFPVKIWYSTDDPTATPGPILTFAAATGASLVSMGAVQHTITSLDNTGVAAFLRQYATP